MSAAASVLNTKVLVLNRSYLPVHITSVRRAFSLLYQGIAQAVDAEYRTFDFDSWSDLSASVHDDTIGLVGRVVRVPRVVLLLAYDRVPRRQVRFSRFNIYSRDSNTCQYCGQQVLAQRPESRSRHPAIARRAVALGERRLFLPCVQSPQGWADSRAGRDAVAAPAATAGVDALHAADLQPAALPGMGAVPLHGRCILLEHGAA